MNGLTTGSLFSGIGLLDYGLTLAGFEHAWFCEADEWRRSILARRWPGLPVHDDVRSIGADTVERVDVIAGGFPCKGASTAGKRSGFDHPETVLWREMARAVGELRPRYVLVENVANILVLRDGAVWGEVLGTLAALGYDTVWDCLPAAAVGAPHRRDRVFAVATDTASVVERDAHDEADAVAGERLARQVPRGGGAEPAADAAWDAEGGPGTPAGTDGQRARTGDHVAADARNGRLAQQPAEHRGEPARPDTDALRRGVRVEWGPYEHAIRRWEQASGVPAPEPLVRRVDDRSAARVERQRLSALGDGVQIQCGYLAGEYIAELERE